MAIGTTIDFNITGEGIIKAAISLADNRSSEIPVENNEISDGLAALNRMVKAWQAEFHLWKRDQGILFLRTGVEYYDIGGTVADQACFEDDFIKTDLSVAGVAGDITLTVTSSAGMQGLIDFGTADKIGIKLDDGTRQWTTIENVNSATSIQIADGLASAAAISNSVFTYTTDIERPLRIEDAQRTVLNSNSDIDMIKFSRQQYFSQPNKAGTGTPTNFYYQPKATEGRVYIWQTASNVDQYIKFTANRAIKDFDTSTNNPDFPVEWADTLVWNLAARLAIEYQTPLQKYQLIKQEAAEMLDAALGWDEETTSLNMQPDFS
jgi:hypothetical protein